MILLLCLYFIVLIFLQCTRKNDEGRYGDMRVSSARNAMNPTELYKWRFHREGFPFSQLGQPGASFEFFGLALSYSLAN